MLPQGVRFECSREKNGGFGGAGTIGFARYPFAGAFFGRYVFWILGVKTSVFKD